MKKHHLIPDEQVHQICQMYEADHRIPLEQIKQAVNPNNLSIGMIKSIISGKARKDIGKQYSSISYKIQGSPSFGKPLSTNQVLYICRLYQKKPTIPASYVIEHVAPGILTKSMIDDILHGRTYREISKDFTLPYNTPNYKETVLHKKKSKK